MQSDRDDGFALLLAAEGKQGEGQERESSEGAGGLGQHGVVARDLITAIRNESSRGLLEDHYDIRMIQELLGHKDVTTAMIYTHILNREGHGVDSPADRLCL
ncbi:MAG TPA: tyrosine-type recombinase/integrase [Nitrospira sp.]|nr:tyrosine-type recombinase/integrase [Nitrospira sp.]